MYKAGRDGGYDNAKTFKGNRGLLWGIRQFLARRRWERILVLILLFFVVYYYYPRADESDVDSAVDENATPTLDPALALNASDPSAKPQAVVTPLVGKPVDAPPTKAPESKPLDSAKAAVKEEAQKVADGKAKEQPQQDYAPPPVAPPASLALSSEHKALWKTRQKAVVGAFRHAWKGYKDHAWGKDHLLPISKTGKDWFGLGLTIIDSLDTAYIMGEMDVFNEAKAWVAKDLKFDSDENSNVFEITIRVLGGLLSAYHLSGETEKPLLDKAVELANILLKAFETKTKIPLASVNFHKRIAVAAHDNMGASSTSEVTTLQMEFKYLAYLTGEPKYWNAVQEVSKIVKELPKKDGLVPLFIFPETASFLDGDIRLGSRADSYYEYLAKQYFQTNYTETTYHTEFNLAIDGVRKHLLALSHPNELFYIGELQNYPNLRFSPKMDHLVCFLPTVLALTATKGKRVTAAERGKMSVRDRLDLELAEELTRGCYEQYRQTKSGIAPEIVYWKEQQPPTSTSSSSSLAERIFAIQKQVTSDLYSVDVIPERYLNSTLTTTIPPSLAGRAEIRPLYGKEGEGRWEEDFVIHSSDSHNWLRPETVEALFTMWRVTGYEKYREWGWEVFESFERWAKVEGGGYSNLDDVRKVPPTKTDKMETFFLGETLKYFYLLFTDETAADRSEDAGGGLVIPLDKYVFNTEAHPFPVFEVGEGGRLRKGELVWL
ncbi:mannosyl-oligosaccharide alpha-1,2-mannosidase [Rhizophlyctis rosea]|nr:mannosyl-oligosaccharide alpha-1,2-mannosidase [Rhizophlyctis rosea]